MHRTSHPSQSSCRSPAHYLSSTVKYKETLSSQCYSAHVGKQMIRSPAQHICHNIFSLYCLLLNHTPPTPQAKTPLALSVKFGWGKPYFRGFSELWVVYTLISLKPSRYTGHSIASLLPTSPGKQANKHSESQGICCYLAMLRSTDLVCLCPVEGMLREAKFRPLYRTNSRPAAREILSALSVCLFCQHNEPPR